MKLQKKLLNWFREYQRPLPWRKTYDPYQVWISEIMLQQTQVKTVLPYFERWMQALPTIQSVARASENKILKMWEGLGYYSRARNIQKAAKMIVAKFKGKFPEHYDDILNLPGVGKYTAGAIASIAFNQNYPVVDGNVVRILTRLTYFTGNVKRPRNIAFLWKKAGDLLPKGRAREFNQALMELGALICKPQNPACHACPVQKICSSLNCARDDKTVFNRVPNLGKRKKLEFLQVVLAVIKKGGRVFIQKRPSQGLMGGLWEFPGGKIESDEKPEKALLREIKEELGVSLKNLQPITHIDHGYTRFKVRLHCFSADYNSGRVRLTAATQGKWVNLHDLQRYAFPAANTRLIREFLA